MGGAAADGGRPAGALADRAAGTAGGRADGGARRRLPAVADAPAQRAGRLLMSARIALHRARSAAGQRDAGPRPRCCTASTSRCAAGRWTSIVGPNGAGKSTLLKVLAGLLPHRRRGAPARPAAAATAGARARAAAVVARAGRRGRGQRRRPDGLRRRHARPPAAPALARGARARPIARPSSARCAARRPGTGATGRSASSRAASASACCWRARWPSRPRCC